MTELDFERAAICEGLDVTITSERAGTYPLTYPRTRAPNGLDPQTRKPEIEAYLALVLGPSTRPRLGTLRFRRMTLAILDLIYNHCDLSIPLERIEELDWDSTGITDGSAQHRFRRGYIITEGHRSFITHPPGPISLGGNTYIRSSGDLAGIAAEHGET
ncbi:hypothetical protein CALCODRAFT_148348 [Calocera cornea HHB12733]|uniref:Uncharacterized protein n=1 Tax=Calocera cornea HHB12733 TaxID=1353952 RepID=A0A165CQ64_9BASI|nr:hypothetical protein CALCODRAFT_148348 [Calocera cornea HHB12733]